MPSKEYIEAVNRLADEASAGKVRDTNEPVARVRKPEPSNHPDPRMGYFLGCPELTLQPVARDPNAPAVNAGQKPMYLGNQELDDFIAEERRIEYERNDGTR